MLRLLSLLQKNSGFCGLDDIGRTDCRICQGVQVSRTDCRICQGVQVSMAILAVVHLPAASQVNRDYVPILETSGQG